MVGFGAATAKDRSERGELELSFRSQCRLEATPFEGRIASLYVKVWHMRKGEWCLGSSAEAAV